MLKSDSQNEGTSIPGNKDALPLGTLLDSCYKIEQFLGGGGFGLVYKANHIHLDSVVAIKELFPRNITVRVGNSIIPASNSEADIYAKTLDSFRKEAKNLGKLQKCDFIVKCLDYFEENNTGYLVMEYIEGKSLKEIIKLNKSQGKSFSQQTTLSLLKGLLAGLKVVHEAKIQHMDIKPENIYLRGEDNLEKLERPVLLDFGATRSKTGYSTQSGLLVGTIPYAPIEQMHNGILGAWTDIYALGITLYELVFGDEHIPECTRRMSEVYETGKDPLWQAELRRQKGYSENLLELIDKCIELEATNRFQSIEEIEEVLKAEKPNIEQKERTTKNLATDKFILKNVYLKIAKHIKSGWITLASGRQAKNIKENDYDQDSLQVTEELWSLSDSQTGQPILLTDSILNSSDGFVIGRSQLFCHKTLPNQYISIRHVRFFMQNGNLYIEDLNTTNGTYIGGTKIKPFEFNLINDGDEIELAEYRFFVSRNH